MLPEKVLPINLSMNHSLHIIEKRPLFKYNVNCSDSNYDEHNFHVRNAERRLYDTGIF